MSMSTYVVGFRPPDEKWKAMKAVYDSCLSARVDVPKDVEEFFGFSPPDSSGVEVNLKDAIQEWWREGANGFQIEIEKIPKDIKFIRFYNTW